MKVKLKMKCGNCHGEDFEIYLQPVKELVRIIACVCTGCKKVRPFDDKGVLQSPRVPGSIILPQPISKGMN